MGNHRRLSPGNGTSTANTKPLLSWGTVTGAVNYEVQITGSAAGWGTAPVYDTPAVNYTPAAALTNNTTHYWRVRAVDGDNQKGDWSEVSSLSVNWGAVSGLRPANSASTTDTTPDFSWNPVTGADSYEIQIADSPEGLPNAAAATVTGTDYTPGTVLTNNTTHYWRVRAVDGENQKGDWSEVSSLSVNWGAVSGLSPANSASTTDTTPTFSWNTVTGADSYEIQIAGSQNGLPNAAAVSVIGTATYTPGTVLTNNTTHYWRVRAVDGDGQQGAWSTEHSLEVAIGTVSGLSPSNGASTTDTTPGLSWNAVDGAARYEIQIADSPEGLPNAAAVPVTGTNYTPGTVLTNNTTHYWRVRAVDGENQKGDWSEVSSLSVNWGAVSGLRPSDEISTTDTTPDFSWNPVTGADSYEIQIADSPEGLPNAAAVSVTGTNYTPETVLTNNTTHYWRVRAVDGDNQKGAWSAMSSLNVMGTVSGLSPVNKAETADTTPTFRWYALDGADSYEIQIAGSQMGLNSATAVPVNGTNYTPETALTNNKTHYWRVRAVDGDTQRGDWSTAHSLEVKWGTISWLSPSNGTSTTNTKPLLSWGTVTGAVNYEVQIADSEGGVANSVAIDVTDASYTPATALTNLQTHYWQVRAKNANGQYGPWSAIHSLEVNWGAIDGLSPSDRSTTTDTTPALSWNAVSGAAGYEVQIADSEGGVANSVAIDVTDASYTPSTALTNNQTHYWRVRAKDGDGQYGAWSAVQNLTVNIGAVSGLSPANGSATTDTTPGLSWNAVPGAVSYEIQIAGSQNGLNSATAVPVTGTNYTPAADLMSNKVHYWRVRAVDGEKQRGDWSTAHSLNVQGTVGGLSPADGESTADTTPDFSWNTVTGADSYEIQIAGSQAGLDTALIHSTPAENYTPAAALTNNATHYWRVRAVYGSSSQKGLWSTAHSLSVKWGAISWLSPADGASTADTTPNFSWDAVVGAAHYEIQIADSQDGLPGAAAVSVTGAAAYTPGTALTNNTTHYWRVRAVDSSGQAGSWSEAYSLVLTDGFVYVEGGSFQMGSDGHAWEKPVHQVTVSPFYMSKYEVTQGEWRDVMKSSPSGFSGDNLPVEQVSWSDAVKYCNALSVQKGLTPVYTINGTSVTANWSADGYRLPTEAEWEYAARGGKASKGYLYAGSDNTDEVGWYSSNSGQSTHPVSGKAPNELELYDMSGNVREWCWDWYGAYSSGSQSDPRGPASGSNRVNRGGSWFNSDGDLRSTYRSSLGPGSSYDDLGFRLVRGES